MINGENELRATIKTEESRLTSVCTGCHLLIRDQFIYSVTPGLTWHAACLRCAECKQRLDENRTCFIRDRSVFCRDDYRRLYGMKCSKCEIRFSSEDLVMKTSGGVYHVDCFRCMVCSRLLRSGEEFSLHADGPYCLEDQDHHNPRPSGPQTIDKFKQLDTLDTRIKSKEEKTEDSRDETEFNAKIQNISDSYSTSDSLTTSPESLMSNSSARVSTDSGISPGRSPHGPGHRRSSGAGGTSSRTGRSGGSGQKSTRIRTVMSEMQLHTLRTCYAANPRPDALVKEQLVEMTGLSSRVIRVWFQNKRCKDKKRTILMKHLQEQQQQQSGPNELLPLRVASSPALHCPTESSLPNPHPHLTRIDLHPSSWKDLSSPPPTGPPPLPHFPQFPFVDNNFEDLHFLSGPKMVELHREIHLPIPSQDPQEMADHGKLSRDTYQEVSGGYGRNLEEDIRRDINYADLPQGSPDRTGYPLVRKDYMKDGGEVGEYGSIYELRENVQGKSYMSKEDYQYDGYLKQKLSDEIRDVMMQYGSPPDVNMAPEVH